MQLRETIYEKAAQAAFLHERMNGLSKSVKPSESELAEWESYVCMHGGKDKFDLRLELDGYDRELALALTGEQRFADAPPEWAKAFEDMISLFPYGKRFSSEDETYRRTESRIGKGNFSLAMFPFLDYADSFLSAGVRNGMGPDALVDLRANLLCEITMLCASVYKAERREWLLKNYPAAIFVDSGEYSAEFDEKLLGGGWAELLLKYPVMTRQIYTLCVQWAQNTAFMFRCLDENRDALLAKGILRPDAGNIARLTADAGDRHNGGRRVVILEFANGQKLVFKPRSLLIDKAFHDFLDWLRESGYQHKIKTPAVLFGDDYGFAEFVENTPVESVAGFGRFYARMGELSALLYIFGGNDFHYENVIAWGEYPVLTDTESLLLHKVRPFEDVKKSGHVQVFDILSDSVLRIGFFPHWVKAGEKDGLQNAGALYVHEKENNSPHFNGIKKSVEQYEPEFKEGFRRLYLHLFKNKKALLSDKSPLHLFQRANFRYLTRQSQVYADMLRHMNNAAYLKNGLTYSTQAERLAPAFLFFAEGETLKKVWKLYKGEYMALTRMDIPIFFGEAGSVLVKSEPGQTGSHYFLESAIERAQSLCARLSEDNLKTQTELIDAAMGLVRNKAHGNAAVPLPQKESCAPLTDAQLISEAVKIYETIMAAAIGGEHPTWLVTHSASAGGGLSLGSMPATTLYEGKIGLGVFFAALYRATGEAQIKRDVLKIMNDVLDFWGSAQTPWVVKNMSLGLSQGIGGLIRGIDLVSRYLDDGSYLDCIAQIPVTKEKVAADGMFDVIGGAAGMSIAAYHACRRVAAEKYAQILALCAEHLYGRQDPVSGAWEINKMPPLSGLGHGAAGMALALLRGYEVTGREEWLDGARRAISFENTLYCEEMHNWQDLRDSKKTELMFMQGWCSGAPGIGLARLAGLGSLDNEQIRQDIENALTQTKLSFAGSDHLCCGQAGRADFLLEASLRLDRPELLDEARLLLSRTVFRSAKEGGYIFNSRRIGLTPPPSLFQGMAGVGYELLRCAAPREYASVLI